jgi:hypothetical protein
VRATGGMGKSKDQGSSSSSTAPLVHQRLDHSATVIGLKLRKELFEEIDIKLAKFLVDHSFSEKKEYVKRSIHNEDDQK